MRRKRLWRVEELAGDLRHDDGPNWVCDRFGQRQDIFRFFLDLPLGKKAAFPEVAADQPIGGCSSGGDFQEAGVLDTSNCSEARLWNIKIFDDIDVWHVSICFFLFFLDMSIFEHLYYWKRRLFLKWQQMNQLEGAVQEVISRKTVGLTPAIAERQDYEILKYLILILIFEHLYYWNISKHD